MSSTIRLKRTFTPGKVPTIADLEDGESGINVADGIIYTREASSIKVVGTAIRDGVVPMRTNSLVAGEDIEGHNWWAPDHTGFIPVVEGGELKWGNSDAKSYLIVPCNSLGIGGALVGYLDASQLTSDRTHVLPNKDGTYLLDADLDKQHISGFGFRASGGSIEISAGSAYVPSLAHVIEYPGGTFNYIGTIPNSTTIHVYLNAGGFIEVSAIQPSAPYFGTARSRSASTSRRYLFSVRSKPSGNQLYPARGVAFGNVVDVTFLNNTSAENTIVTNGSSATPYDLDVSSFCPAQVTTDLNFRVLHSGSSGVVRLYAWSGSSFNIWSNVSIPNSVVNFTIPCNQTPKIQYDVTSGATTTVTLLGYRIER